MASLDEVLRDAALNLRVLVDGDRATPVRWVATSELADPTPFLEGGEIVLSTGLATAAWADEWGTYVRRLRAAGAVALGLGVGLTHADVPAPLRAAAADAGLALFAVPHEVPFVAISRAVARLLAEEERRELQTALSVQRQLTRAAADPAGGAAVLRRLATIVRGEALVCAADGAVLARAGRPADPPIGQAAAYALIERLRPAGLRASHTTAGPGGGTLAQPLGLTGAPHSYLVLAVPGPWDGAQRSAVATAVALLSLEGERRADALTAAREIRAAALGLLLAGRTEPGQALLALRTAAAAPLTGARFRVLRMAHADGPGPTAGEADRPRGADGVDVLAALERWARAAPTTRLVAALPAGAEDGHAAGGSRLLKHVAVVAAGGGALALAPIAAALGQGGRIGLGEARPIADLATAEATARAALRRTSPAQPVARFDDIVDDGLPALFGLLGAATADGFARRVLGPLARPSAAASVLLTTLDAFHRHHGQLTVVAAELGVHRNTVRRRLRRVGELTGRSPDSPRGRAELWVAQEIHRSTPGSRTAS